MSDTMILENEPNLAEVELSLAQPVGNLSDEQAERFVDLVDAVGVLSKVTEHGLTRVVNAVNGLHRGNELKKLAASDRSTRVTILAERIEAREFVGAKNKPEKYQLKNRAEKAKETPLKSGINAPKSGVSTVETAKPQRSIAAHKTEFNQLKKSVVKESKTESQVVQNESVKQHKVNQESTESLAALAAKKIIEEKSSTVEDFKTKPKKTPESRDYYTDSNGRLRKPTGHYASKEEAKKYRGQDGLGSKVLSSMGSMFGGKSMRGELIGRAFFGSAYGVIEEVMETKEQIQNALSERDIKDVQSAKAYLGKKKDHIKGKVHGVFNGMQRGKAIATDGVRYAGSALKNRLSARSQLSNPPITESQYKVTTKKMSDKETAIAKEHHGEQQDKMDKLIGEVEDLQLTAGGGNGGGLFDGLGLDFDLDRNKRNRKTPRAKSKLGRIGNFFRGTAKAAPAMATGALASGGFASGAVASGGAKAGIVAGGKLLSKALPIVAAATTAFDAYDGFTDEDKQRAAFNLKKTDEPDIGHKTSMALGSVLDLGGITSGVSGWLGEKLESVGFDGAKDAMTFDSTDIAKSTHKFGSNLSNSTGGLFSSLADGDFKGAISNAGNLVKMFMPLMTLKDQLISDAEVSSQSDKVVNNTQTKTNENNTLVNETTSTLIETPQVMRHEAKLQHPTPNIADLKKDAQLKEERRVNRLNESKTIVAKDPDVLKTLKKIEKALVNQNSTKSNTQEQRLSVGVNASHREINTRFSDPLTERLASE